MAVDLARASGPGQAGGDGVQGALDPVVQGAVGTSQALTRPERRRASRTALIASRPAGRAGLIGNPAAAALHDADTLLLLGRDFPYRHRYPSDRTVMEVDTDATHIVRRVPVDVVLVGDTGAAVRDLLHYLAWPLAGTGASCADICECGRRGKQEKVFRNNRSDVGYAPACRRTRPAGWEPNDREGRVVATTTVQTVE
ncbi:hypothetical protein ACWCXW_42565, partial [Streptomyces sp. NPDC001640]